MEKAGKRVAGASPGLLGAEGSGRVQARDTWMAPSSTLSELLHPRHDLCFLALKRFQKPEFYCWVNWVNYE